MMRFGMRLLVRSRGAARKAALPGLGAGQALRLRSGQARRRPHRLRECGAARQGGRRSGSRVVLLLAVGGAALLLAGCPRPEPAPTATPQPKAPPPKAVAAADVPEYVCVRTKSAPAIDGHLDDAAWRQAAPIGPFRQWNGSAAGQATTARMLWDDRFLYVAFDCVDDDIQGTMKQRDQNLWEENEVVEVFADPGGTLQHYLEFEVNPLNTVVDLIIPYRGDPRSLQASKGWDSKGLKTAVTRGRPPVRPHPGWSVEMAIPMGDFFDPPHTPPQPGDAWRLNLYRVDARAGKVQYQAWSPTMTPQPAFHVPERFGAVGFGGEAQ